MSDTKPLRLFSDDVRAKALANFHILANSQRGRPEILATVIKANPGLWNAMGVFTFLCEHVGDLTHRMAEPYCDRMDYGFGPVSEKVARGLRYIKSDHGYWREVETNLRNNFKYSVIEKGLKTDFDQFKQDFFEGAKLYADAHSKLIVWNDAQWNAREAAVSLGLRQFSNTELHLTIMQNNLNQGREHWSDWASTVTVENNELVPFTKGR